MPIVRTSDGSPRSRWPAALSKPVVCVTPGSSPVLMPMDGPPSNLIFYEEVVQPVTYVPSSPPRMQPDLVYQPPTPAGLQAEIPSPIREVRPIREVSPLTDFTPVVSEVEPIRKFEPTRKFEPVKEVEPVGPVGDVQPAGEIRPVGEVSLRTDFTPILEIPKKPLTPQVVPIPAPTYNPQTPPQIPGAELTPIFSVATQLEESVSETANITYKPLFNNSNDMTGLDLYNNDNKAFRARLEPYLLPRRNAHIDITGHEEQLLSQCCSRDGIRKDLYETALRVIQSLYNKQVYIEQGKSALLRGLGLELPIKGGPVFTDKETAMILAALWQVDEPFGDKLEFEKTLYGIINMMIGHIRRPEDEFYKECKVSPPRERHSNRMQIFSQKSSNSSNRPEDERKLSPLREKYPNRRIKSPQHDEEQRYTPPRDRYSPVSSIRQDEDQRFSPSRSPVMSQSLYSSESRVSPVSETLPPSILKPSMAVRTQTYSPIMMENRVNQSVAFNEHRMPDLGYNGRGVPSYYPSTPVQPVVSMSVSSDRSSHRSVPQQPTREIRTFSCPSACRPRESMIDFAAKCHPGLPSPKPVRTNYDPRVPLRGSEAPRQLPSEYYANIRKGSRMRPPGSSSSKS